MTAKSLNFSAASLGVFLGGVAVGVTENWVALLALAAALVWFWRAADY